VGFRTGFVSKQAPGKGGTIAKPWQKRKKTEAGVLGGGELVLGFPGGATAENEVRKNSGGFVSLVRKGKPTGSKQTQLRGPAARAFAGQRGLKRREKRPPAGAEQKSPADENAPDRFRGNRRKRNLALTCGEKKKPNRHLPSRERVLP